MRRVHHTTVLLPRRPGDTIELEAAQVHEAADIAVRWPLRLRGNGAAPEDTLLVCPRGADAALAFRCGGLHGTRSASPVHHRGTAADTDTTVVCLRSALDEQRHFCCGCTWNSQ